MNVAYMLGYFCGIYSFYLIFKIIVDSIKIKQLENEIRNEEAKENGRRN